MAKIWNHKIFNLIIMIIAVFVIFGVPNVSYAEDVVYSASQDYVEKDDSDVENINKKQSMWTQINNNEFFKDVRANVAKWYYVFRYMAIAIMLGILVVLAIKLALASLAPRKALYKKMLVDWLVCFILLFMSHYYMIFIQYLNDWILSIIRNIGVDVYTNGKYDLYETVKSRAYDIRFTIGFPGMFLYITLLYFTAKYIYIYAKRFILLIILTVIAPITMLFYSVQKILTGKSQVFTKWMEEYAINVLIQAIHAIIYVVFVGTALRLSETSILGVILSFVFLNFMSKADKMFRKIFKFSSRSSMAEELSNSQLSEIKDNLSNAVMAATLAKQTEIGQKISGAISTASTHAAIRIGGLVQGTDAYQKLVEDHNLDMEKRENKLNDNILAETKKAKDAQEKLDNNQYVNAKEKAKLEKAVKKAEKGVLKNTTKRQNLVIMRGVFERMREAFDYDNYTEFVESEDGDYDVATVTDADGNDVETIVRVAKGTGKYKRQTIKSRKIFNAETRKYEKVGGVSQKFQEKKDEILGLTKEQKEILSEAKTMIKDEVMGFGSTLLGMGFFADNPSVGLLLLANGGKKWRDLNKQKNPVKMNRTARKAIKRVLKQQYKHYKHERFSTGSLLSIDETIRYMNRTDVTVGRINNFINGMRAGLIRFAVPMAPFVLTGNKGLAYNAVEMTKKAEKQLMDDIKAYERSVDVELKKALVSEIAEANEEFLKEITQYLLDKDIARMIFENRRKNKTIIRSKNGKAFVINTNSNKNNIGTMAKIREVIISVAMRKHMSSLDELDLGNEQVRRDMIKSLKQAGVITGTLDALELEQVLLGEAIDETEKANLMLVGTKFLEAENQDSNQAYIVDLERTIDSGLYNEQKAYIQAKAGASIETFAYSIAGKNLVGEFNGFSIDTTMFADAEEIIKAYYIFKGLDVITHNDYKEKQKAYYRSIGRSFDSTIVGANLRRVMDMDGLMVPKIKPMKGASIEDFAAQIVGKNIITTYGGFTIDTRYYQTAEDIVNAYRSRKASDTLVNDEMIVVDVDQEKGIDEIANKILGKNILTEYDGFVIDTSKFSTADEIIEQYKQYKENDTADENNTDINIRNIKYGEEYYKKVGIEGFISMMGSGTPDIMKKKIYENVLRQYIETHDLNGPEDLYNPRVQAEIKKWYNKELSKDSSKKAVLAIALRTKKSLSDLRAKDILTEATESDIEQFRRRMFGKLDGSAKAAMISATNIPEVSLENMFTQQLDEINTTIDKIVLGVLSKQGVVDPTGVDLNNATTPDVSRLKRDMLIFAKASGIEASDEDVIALLQDRIDKVSSEDVENAIISNMVSEFIVDKCDGDSSKLQSDAALADELNQMILEKFDTLSSSATSDEQKEKVEDVIGLIGKKGDDSTAAVPSAVGNYVSEKVEGDASTDPNIDLDIPLPEVNAELVNDILVCNFKIPSGVNDVKIESCLKSLDTTNEKFISGVDIINLENAKSVACSRLTKGGKYGPTLVVRYPEELLNIAGKVNEGIVDKQTDRETETIAEDVIENISMLKKFATPKDVFGEDNVEILKDEEIQLLFRTGEIKKAQNITQGVVERFRESGTSVIKEEDDEKLTQEIVDAILNNDYTIGMRADYDTDTDKFDAVRKKSTDLLQSLLQWKAVDEDLDKLKVKKDSKNYKKSRKANQDLDDKFNEVDIENIIQTMHSGRGGRV